MKILKVKKLSSSAILPTRATVGAAGYDLYADLSAPITIKPNEVIKIPTGIAIELESNGYVALVYARSGLSSKSLIAPVNCVGVVDSDYRGELLIPLINHGNKDYTFNNGDRIAQMIVTPIFTPEIVEVAKLSQTVRGDGGFGSTDKNR